MIDLRIQASISYRGDTFSRFIREEYEYSTYPMVSVFDKSGRENLLLVGGGGLGKSTAVSILEAELLIRGVPSFIVRCNTAEIPRSKMQELLSMRNAFEKYPADTVFIIDAWDELSQHDGSGLAMPFFKKVKELGYKVIVTSRFDPADERQSEGTDREEAELFRGLDKAFIQEFEENELEEIIDMSELSSSTIELLTNTMFLSMYLQVSTEGKQLLNEAECEAVFIRNYFLSMFEAKKSRLNEHAIDRLFAKIGHSIVNESLDKSVCDEIHCENGVYYVKERYRYSSENEPLDLIYHSALNNIISEYIDKSGFYQIKVSHQQYAMFCIAMYYKQLFLSNRCSIFDDCNSLISSKSQAFVYFGELLSDYGEGISKHEIHALWNKKVDKFLFDNSSKSNIQSILKNYFNTFCLILIGFSNGVFSDSIFSEYFIYIELLSDVCTQFITELCIEDTDSLNEKNIKKLYRMTNLRRIHICINHPTLRSESNCVVRKRDNAVLLGCKKSIIPANAISIEAHAFENCNRIKKINLPLGLISIGDFAFAGCINLQKIDLPPSLSHIGMYAFAECQTIETIHIPDGITVIEKCTFNGCVNLQNIQLPNSIVSIKEGAFFNCSGLENISFSSHLITIESNAFSRCNFKEIQLPDSLLSIGSYAFNRCVNLQSISFPQKLTSIGAFTFGFCTSIQKIDLPNSLTRIESGAFLGCTQIQNVQLPKSLVFLGDFAFAECCNMRYIDISNNLSSLKDGVFCECSNLETLYIPDNITQIVQSTLIDHIVKYGQLIPDTVIVSDRILDCTGGTSELYYAKHNAYDTCAFENCTKLKEVSLPSHLAHLKDHFLSLNPDCNVTIREG